MKRYCIYLGIAIATALMSCENDVNAVRAFDAKKLGVEQAYQVETIMSQEAHVKGVLTAPYMERHLTEPPHTDFPRGLQVVFYSDSLTKESILTANFGTYKENSSEVFLRDSVVFISLKTARRLDCRDLRWDPKTNEFVTDNYCRLTTPTQTLYGQGFRANQDLSRSEFIHGSGSMVMEDSLFSSP